MTIRLNASSIDVRFLNMAGYVAGTPGTRLLEEGQGGIWYRQLKVR